MTDLRKTVAIVGVDESDEIGKVPDKSNLTHHAEAAYNALEDAGMSMKDVNGLFTAGTSTLNLAEYLGIEPSFTDTTAVGGSSFIIHIAHAMAAINAGYCDVALVTHGEAGLVHSLNHHTDFLGHPLITLWQLGDICMSTGKIKLVRPWQRLQ